MPILILPMHHSDIETIARIHSQQFPRQHSSVQWVSCNFAAFPRIMIFVARDEKDQVVGYIQWLQKSGFRSEAVIELEQIAVGQSHQRSGIGTKLIHESLQLIKNYLSDTHSVLKTVIVTTRTDNPVQSLYKKALGAKAVATIHDLFSHDEVIMVAHEL